MKGHSLILSTSKQNHAPLSLEDTIKLLKVSADTKNLKLGKMIHAHLTILSESHQNENIAQTNSLINFYAKCDQIPVARQLFDNMHHRNVVSYSSLMSGYLHYGFSMENLKLFKSMVSVENMRPNEYIFATVLFSCSRSGKVEEGKQYHGYVMKSGLAFHQYVRSALIDLYAKCHDMRMAMQVFNALPGYDVFSYNSILNGLLEHGYLREGVEVLSRMVNECVNWDTTTYVNAFGICACLKDLKLGLQVHGQMLKNDVQIDAFISSAMINMYGKCEKISNARKVFDGLKTRNVVLWTSMLASFFQNGYYEEALNCYNEMEEEDIQPNEFTFAVLLNSAAGLSTEKLLRTSSDNWCIINDGADTPAIVMGISGKPSELLEVGSILRDQVPVIRRFTGGGTVVVDNGTVFVTLICNKDAVPGVQPYPRSIMYWSGLLYNEVFRGTGDFQLRENGKRFYFILFFYVYNVIEDFDSILLLDYVFGDRKFGGNAQSITKNRWIHHTSFLWDYKVGNMAYLKQPARAPKYRLARDHTKFICRMKDYMPRSVFIENTIESIETYFSVQPANLEAIDTSSEANFVHSTRLLTKQELEEACESQLENIGVNV
ncbi:hypothetical protein Patl1_21892 [Pistacia atlantica]|uniref:Uncharacterized protein n=1 Tax=Pistacia atlantica TaxID=434234 RepID=A0ACC1BM18_9ROSI|nr:hypothetical protein Patl1_21892 [Pistacia atlantica]